MLSPIPENEESTECDYDRIDLRGSPKSQHRPHSLSDASDGYAHLQFLDFEKPKQPQVGVIFCILKK